MEARRPVRKRQSLQGPKKMKGDYPKVSNPGAPCLGPNYEPHWLRLGLKICMPELDNKPRSEGRGYPSPSKFCMPMQGKARCWPSSLGLAVYAGGMLG